jgi:hypothetical protein
MRRLILVSILVAVASMACAQPTDPRAMDEAAGPPAARSNSAPKSRDAGSEAPTACDLLAPSEIARFLHVADVKNDEINSGRNVQTQIYICNWYVKQGSSEGIEVRLRRAESSDEGAVLLAFSAAKGDAVEHDEARNKNVQAVAGVGQEALYSPYPVGSGGSVVFRKGPAVVTITGSASKDALMAMAKLAARSL